MMVPDFWDHHNRFCLVPVRQLITPQWYANTAACGWVASSLHSLGSFAYLYHIIRQPFMSDPVEMSAPHPRFLPNGVLAVDLLASLGALEELPRSYACYSPGK